MVGHSFCGLSCTFDNVCLIDGSSLTWSQVPWLWGRVGGERKAKGEIKRSSGKREE